MPDPEIAQFTGVFRTRDAHRITRNRKPVSCTACQRRKSRCDRARPSCGACKRRDEAMECVYGEAPDGSSRREMQSKVAKLEEIVKRLAAASAGQKRTESCKDGSDAAYHGETSWEAVFQSIHDIQSVLKTEEEDEQPEEPENLPALDIVLGGVAPVTIEELRSSMPSRQDADILIRTYFDAKFLVVPFTHERHFWRRYELFWSRPHEANFLWLSIMFSVLSLGAMIAKVKGSLLETVAGPSLYMHRSAQCLITGEYLNAKSYSVEALMMFAHSRNVQKVDSDATIWSLYGLAVRLAQRRGYHLDAARVSPNITPFEAEMRRRTWFMVQTSDLLFSFQLGMPPMVYQEVCDADHPRNLTDDDFDEDTDVPPSRPPIYPTPLLAWRIKSHLCRLIRRVLIHTLAVEPRPYEETMGLQAELEAVYDSIPPCYNIRPINSTSPEDQGHTIMHRLILELSYRKTLCVLHRPYLSFAKDEPRYRLSRDICRAAAQRILDLHLEFDEAIREGGRMYHDRFMVSSLTMHDFLVAAMILCLDLCESTDISPHDRQHRIQLLQRAHSIWNERGTKSKDARHAAKVLRAILIRVETPTISEPGTLETVSTEYAYIDGGASGAMPDLAGISIAEYPIDYQEFLPMENFFGSAEGFDWISIDHYLRSGNEPQQPPTNQPPPEAVEYMLGRDVGFD
ncbi:Zn(2)-C6 fungal-type domain-containing protein [Fusarium sp. LHS14.1]|nr:Zn(2)-C6 fungal-type domain-containing protein [Fusarium sp. LHS14.1]